MDVRLNLPWPPSVNTYWRNLAGRTVLSAKGRQYKVDVTAAVLTQLGRIPRLSNRLSVTLILSPPDRRKRDIDNHIKAVFDALTHAGVWEDDEQVDELTVLRESVLKGGSAVVEITRTIQGES